jgi:hypothetical protein
MVGRDDAVMLVHALTDRSSPDGRPRSRRQPVLVLEGAHGSGKTALLTVLRTLLDQNVPYARIDFESERAATPAQVLSAIAFQLSRACPGYGTITFPRFTIARMVMTARLDLTDHQVACRQVHDALQKQRGGERIRQILLGTTGALSEILQQQMVVPAPARGLLTRTVTAMVESGFGRLTRWRPGRRVVLGAYTNWFGHRGRGLTHDAIDILVDLNGYAQAPADGQNEQWTQELLWDALLTDLRDHFSTGRRSRSLEFDCVVLLDNADTRVGREFVSQLVQARSDRPELPDPLTAVVTSRGELLVNVPDHDLIEYAPGDRPDRLPRRSTARYRLSDLSIADVRGMVMALGLRGGNATRTISMVHQFTEGHPASTRTLVNTLGRHPIHRDSMATLIEQAEAGLGADRARVRERMLTDLLTGFGSDSFEDLVTCSAAMQEHHAQALVGLLDGGESGYERIRPALWPPAGGAGPRVLRRLLLQHLAERPSDHPQAWDVVFHRHRQTRASATDGVGELYYALAAADLTFVVTRLAELLATMPGQEWLDLVAIVVQAPHRRAGVGISPHDELLARLGERPNQLHPDIARLVLAGWILADPLTDSRRGGLYLQMAAELEAIARSGGRVGVEPLLRAAREHRNRAELWD